MKAPLLLGVGIKYKWAKLAEKARKLSRPFFLVLLIVFPCVGLWVNR